MGPQPAQAAERSRVFARPTITRATTAGKPNRAAGEPVAEVAANLEFA